MMFMVLNITITSFIWGATHALLAESQSPNPVPRLAWSCSPLPAYTSINLLHIQLIYRNAKYKFSWLSFLVNIITH